MKKISEIEFLKNSIIEVPVSISHSYVSIDYDTTSSTSKCFTEHMAVEIAGEPHVFISEKNEQWDYIDEGNRASHMLSNAKDYTMSSPMLNDSRTVHARDLDHERMMSQSDVDESSNPQLHGRSSWNRRKLIKPSLHYTITDNNKSNELDSTFEIALIANVAAMSDRSYKANWNDKDKWNDRSEFNSDEANQRIDSLATHLPGEPQGMMIKLPMSAYNYDLLRDHIAAVNPHFDMRIIDGFQTAKQTIVDFNEPKEAGELTEKLIDIMSKFDKHTQNNMLSFINKSSTPMATNFINNSYDRIYVEPKEKAHAEPTM
ncbi:hypothetical protein LMH73_009090 [Vibrio splendidus]|nr:hypothetical protein [Vibrio splendidus]MCC4880321.1 hypothetical protein [Vibrio splendidus]